MSKKNGRSPTRYNDTRVNHVRMCLSVCVRLCLSVCLFVCLFDLWHTDVTLSSVVVAFLLIARSTVFVIYM